MNVLVMIFKWGRGAVIAVFVIAYLVILLTYNVTNIVEPQDVHADLGPDLRKKCTYCLTGAGTNQRWNMFAPNVGTISYSPVVVLHMKDGERIALHSEVEPDLPHWEGPGLIPNDVEGEAREYEWRLHLMDGRIRKLESKATKPAYSYWKVRTTYTRWRLVQWIQDNPERKGEIKRAELWRVKIRHPGYGHELTCESATVLHLYPQMDPLWPIPVDRSYPFYHYP